MPFRPIFYRLPSLGVLIESIIVLKSKTHFVCVGKNVRKKEIERFQVLKFRKMYGALESF